jgi:hypothetical protein
MKARDSAMRGILLVASGLVLSAGLGCGGGGKDAGTREAGTDAGAAPAAGPGASGSAPPEAVERTAGGCPVQGLVTGPDGAPIPAAALMWTAQRQVSERTWSGVAAGESATGDDGRFQFEAPCGSRILFDFGPLQWIDQPAVVTAESGMADLGVHVVPLIAVKLRAINQDGSAIRGAAYHREPSAKGLPIPEDGLIVEGLPFRGPAGEIRVGELPPRSWVLERSDRLTEAGPYRYEADVIVGAGAAIWVDVAPELQKDVGAVFCIQDGVRGERCKQHQSLWRCDCATGAQLAISGPRWDVAILREPRNLELELSELPKGAKTCVRVPDADPASGGGGGTRSFSAQPRGVEGGLLIGTASRPLDGQGRACLVAPLGEPLELRVDGSAAPVPWVADGSPELQPSAGARP